jgi:pimeloyl-ACP methyl ester carboxylesterase
MNGLSFFASMLLLAILFTLPANAQTELPRQGFLGAQVASVPEEQRAQLKLPAEQGIVVLRVDKGSSAEVAGLAVGDIILKANETNVNTAPAFVGIISPFRAGQKVTLIVLRNQSQQPVTVTLNPRPFETNPDFDVIYRSVDTKGGRRRVIITKPKAAGKYPAVLLVGGIGCYSLDNFAPDHAYRKMLYGMTQAGFATMRVEKTGMGDSEGAPCQSPQADLQQEIEGYVAGLRALKTYNFVNAEKTFIFGHSIGGIVGPAVAAEVPVRGIIVSETVATNWFEYGLENYRRQAVLGGMPYEEVETAARLNRVCKLRSWVEKQTPEQLLKDLPACADYIRYPTSYTYMQQLTELNLAETWKKVDAPTLIIYGSSDFLTSAEEHEYLRDMVNRFHPGKATYVEIKGMDHYFERAATQRESMERRRNQQAAPPAQFDERALAEALRWLKQNLAD